MDNTTSTAPTKTIRGETFSGDTSKYCYDETCEAGYGYHGDRLGNCRYCGRRIMPHWNKPRKYRAVTPAKRT